MSSRRWMQARNWLRHLSYSVQFWLLAIITVMRDRMIHAFPCFQHLDPCVGMRFDSTFSAGVFGLPFDIVYVL